jgi:hypothetical protein
VQVVLERGGDPEVAAAAAQAPEQLGVLVRARVHEAPVGGDDVGADQVVGGQAVLAHEPTDAAAEREAGDPRARHEPAGRRQPKGLGLVVELRPLQTRLGDCTAGLGIDADALHRREVDHDAAVVGREPGDAVRAAAHGDDELLAARELDGAHDVGDARAAHDERRAPVVRTVPDRARLVVARVAGRDQLAAQRLRQLGDRPIRDRRVGHLLGCHGVLPVSFDVEWRP